MLNRVHAQPDTRLDARVTRTVAMHYRAGADAIHDRPAHVRAASGLAWVGRQLAVIQDDANFIALVDPLTGTADVITLPGGEGGLRQFDDARGNKKYKLDLEALTEVPGAAGPLLVGFGSGSKRRRERIVVVAQAGSAHPVVTMYEAHVFFAMLEAQADFSGSDLNVEGALYAGAHLRLFTRANGAARDGLQPVNATCDVSWPALLEHLTHPAAGAPPLASAIVQYDLGMLDGIQLGFTDAAPGPPAPAGRRRVLYAAAAEASPDSTRDGTVAGSVVGVIDEGAGGCSARYARLLDRDGTPFAAKLEGLVLVPGDPTRAMITLDADVHDRASELCEVQLSGPWFDAPAPG